MPRRKTHVKNKFSQSPGARPKSKLTEIRALGAIDIHFHGAFGIDLMHATAPELNQLSLKLWENGVAAFCPTTLSSSQENLVAAVGRIGGWMKEMKKKGHEGAIPLGIHLEGPYISSAACGAHPPELLRPIDFLELEELWEKSFHHLKILTVAPEIANPETLKKLVKWCLDRKILLSLGHSNATKAQAKEAFRLGFSGVTHAWNAMAFHHRNPGILGAAIGNPDVYLEIILDQIHVAPEVIRWTCQLHPPESICFVSDCVPAAMTQPGTFHSFGDLKIQFQEGAGRLSNGQLAGGGFLLSHMFTHWVSKEAQSTGSSAQAILKKRILHLGLSQLKALRIPPRVLRNRYIRWTVSEGGKVGFRSPL